MYRYNPKAVSKLYRCYVRSQNTTCKAEKCEPSTEQYWKRYVLGMHKAGLEIREELVNGTMVNRSYAFPEVRSFKFCPSPRTA